MEGVYQDDYSTAADFTQFENQKENIQPRKQGRSAAKLAEIFSQDESARQRHLDQQKEEFEATLAQVNIANDEDPLDIYHRYVRWTLENFPQGHNHASQLIPLVERATRNFQDDERYQNDPRYLRLWMIYAEHLRDNREELFRFLVSREIGQDLAMFYEEYGTLLEQLGKFTAAGETYQLGIHRRAQPAERLKRRYADFQARMAYRESHPPEPDSDNDEPPRGTASRQGNGGTSTRRSVLGRKPGLLGASQPDALAGRSTTGRPTTATSKANFQIFTDQSRPDPEPASQPLDHPTDGSEAEAAAPWEDFGTHVSRRKENLRDASSWVGTTLPQSGRVRPGVTAATTSAAKKFAIFVDESSSESSPATQAVPLANPIVGAASSEWLGLGYDWYAFSADSPGIRLEPPAENLPITPANPAQRPEYYILHLEWCHQNNVEVSPEELRAAKLHQA